MRLACRMFLLDGNDELYRLPACTFERMLRDPKDNLLPQFARQRVRMSDVAVELVDGQPVRVVWSTFDLLGFDRCGRFDVPAYERHQRVCCELGEVLPIAQAGGGGTIIDAASRFVAQGGCWLPSPEQKRLIGAAALGQLSCRRIVPSPGPVAAPAAAPDVRPVLRRTR